MALISLDEFENLMSKIDSMFVSRNVAKRYPNYNKMNRCVRQNTVGSMERTLANQDIRTNLSTDDYEKYQVLIDVQHFAPDEISVKVADGFVVVECRHAEKRDNHGYVSRQFVRKFRLPQGCLPDTVESQLSSDGVLIVTSPKVLPLPGRGEKIVPIIYTE